MPKAGCVGLPMHLTLMGLISSRSKKINPLGSTYLAAPVSCSVCTWIGSLWA